MAETFYRVSKFVAPSIDTYYTSLLKLFGAAVASKLEGFVEIAALEQIYDNLGPGMWSLLKKLPEVKIVKRIGKLDDYPRFHSKELPDAILSTNDIAEKIGITVEGIVYWMSCSIQGNSFAVVAEQKLDAAKDLDVIYLVEYLPCSQMTNTEKHVRYLTKILS